jgi:hypothetical protein
MPVPSGKEGCANRAAIDLHVARSAHQVLAADLQAIGVRRAANAGLELAAVCWKQLPAAGGLRCPLRR